VAGGVGRQSRKGESNRLPAVTRHTFKTHSTRNCTVKYSIHADESPEGRHGPRRRRASDNDAGIAGTVPRGGAGAQAVSHPENHPADRPQSSRKRFRTRANSVVSWRNPACLSNAVNPRSSFSRRAFRTPRRMSLSFRRYSAFNRRRRARGCVPPRRRLQYPSSPARYSSLQNFF